VPNLDLKTYELKAIMGTIIVINILVLVFYLI